MESNDRGRLACREWVFAIAAFVVYSTVITNGNCVVFFFTYFQNDLNTTAAETGWVGSTVWATAYISSPVAATLESYIGCQWTIVLGSLISPLALVTSSWSSNILHLIILYGVVSGLGHNMCMHATSCLILKTFPTKHRSSAVAFVLVGSTTGSLVFNVIYSKLLEAFGWRMTCRVSGLIIFCASFPALLAIISTNKTFLKRKRSRNREQKDVIRREPNQNLKRSSIEKNFVKLQKEDKKSTQIQDMLNPLQEHSSKAHAARIEVEETGSKSSMVQSRKPTSKLEIWFSLFSRLDVIMLIVAFILLAMNTGVFSVNLISFFDSISLRNHHVVLIMSFATATELLVRICCSIFGRKLQIKNRNVLFLIATSAIMCPLTACFTFTSDVRILLILSTVASFCRAIFITLFYTAGVDVVGTKQSDQGVTLSMYCVGVGLLIGSLPVGAIYDATGSYIFGFYLMGLFYGTGTVLLILIHLINRRSQRYEHVATIGAEEEKL